MEGYTLLEYIESDGTNYIDTGYAPNIGTEYSVDFKIVGVGADQGVIGVVSDNCCIVYDSKRIYAGF